MISIFIYNEFLTCICFNCEDEAEEIEGKKMKEIMIM